jgi:hypothetical protein
MVTKFVVNKQFEIKSGNVTLYSNGDLNLKQIKELAEQSKYFDYDNNNYVSDEKIRNSKSICDISISNSDIFDKTLNYHDIHLQKIIIYEECGHFSQHIDRKISDDMIGTIVVSLNDDFTGGELIIENEKCELNNLSGVFIGLNVYHGVEHVNSGYRVVLIFKVFKKRIGKSRFKRLIKEKQYNEERNLRDGKPITSIPIRHARD